MPLFADDSSGEEADPVHSDDDGAILTLDEPRSARKPIHRITPSTPGQRASRPSPAHGSDNESDPEAKSRVAKRTPAATPRKAGKAPRLTKKALEAAEQKRREGYAQELFDELNKVVFGGGLPAETQLKWSKRLLTTAGRARWHKSRHGVQTSEIELAVKILDSDERIRNTLAHEMCHLACWIINEDPKEAHGPKFRSWARKVMRVRPDMEITTRHDYEIAYKYEWKCQQCDKIYGRHSKSIRPDECVCGACKVGQLIPLFNTRVPKTPRSKISSRLAAERGLASPLVVSSPVSASISVSVCETPHISTPTRGGGAKLKAIMLTGSSDEDASDVEVLAHVLGDVSITGTRAA
ncbi:hypothetical protein POSPLADRAFT_1165418 [Postia placenta MAD-698-R-SB12]|uniref:SprT-like domain-containing protein n=1 Tax=Postia placenta MAD-698-R-SB12 TaxID=670580 RepID=A0A1X6NGZ2_9APHY|nr:hypothetical protein POSPLADRAFT_1165418 [Postia placenta MAD-698-R-SB12]OSX67889.1 hypothetical protein POSPLADRAFT_1165418 [Postia placenta MAD-698-R-SB12]